MSNQWFCQIDDQEIGPISSSELKALTAEGKLGPDDLVRKDGQEGWATASQVNGLTFISSSKPPVELTDSTTTPVVTVEPPRLPPERPPAMPQSDRPSQALSSKGEASTKTGPRDNGAADEIKRVAGAWLGHVGPVVKRVLQEARNVAVATWEQGVRIVRYGVARWELRRAGRGAEEARFAHGKKLYEAGAGDPDLTQQIAELTQQIDDKEAPGEVRETLKRRHRELTLRLSKSAESSPSNLPPSAAIKHPDVTAAVVVHEHQFAACKDAKAALWPQSSNERRLVIVGSLGGTAVILFGVSAVILMVSLWSVFHFGRGDSNLQAEATSPRDIIPMVGDQSRVNHDGEDVEKTVTRGTKRKVPNDGDLRWSGVADVGPLAMGMSREEVRDFFKSSYKDFSIEKSTTKAPESPDATIHVMLRDQPYGRSKYVGKRRDQFPIFSCSIQPRQYVHCYFKNKRLSRVIYEINLRYVNKRGTFYYRGMMPGQTHTGQRGAEATAKKVLDFFDSYPKKADGPKTVVISLRDSGWSEKVASEEDRYRERVINVTYTSQI
jgi:hypothetical protein